jgi:imidazole glycerol-phosphate synthase subunit HisF
LNRNIRLIARIDVKGQKVIKGIRYEGVRVVGDAHELSEKYYQQGIDEIIYLDSVASLYGRNSLEDLVKKVASNVFVPITVGGGIKDLETVSKLLHSGADKVAVNSGAIRNPNLINQIAQKYGSQCMVLSIQAKKMGDKRWIAYMDNGRESSELDVFEWIKKGIELGAGEIMLTSVDQDGTMSGFDKELIRLVSDFVDVPVICSGGLGSKEDFVEIVNSSNISAVAVGSALHFSKTSISDLKKSAIEKGINVRFV